MINQSHLVEEDQIDHQEIEREKKSFGFKGKKSFFKKDESKHHAGFTNNPKYFGKKTSENSSTEYDSKSFWF